MTSKEPTGPAGETGRPSRFRYLLQATAFAGGHAIGNIATSIAVALVIYVLGRRRDDLLGVLILVFAAYSFQSGIQPWAFCGIRRSYRLKWEKKLSASGISAKYLMCVGIVFGAFSAVAVCSLIWFTRPSLAPVATTAIAFCLPFGGFWWVMRRCPRELDADYDDEMTLARTSSEVANSIDLPDLAATEAFGRRLGELLFPNAVVALIGPLGAGKTHLVRAIAEGLGIANPAAVTSPTFTLIHEYPARLPIYHFDAYRLKGPNEFLDLGVTEYFEAGGVCLIEWADKVESALPEERLTIRISVVDENRRSIELTPVGEKYLAMVHHGQAGSLPHGSVG